MMVIDYTLKVIDYSTYFCTKLIMVMDNMVHIIDYSITYFCDSISTPSIKSLKYSTN